MPIAKGDADEWERVAKCGVASVTIGCGVTGRETAFLSWEWGIATRIWLT